MDDQVQLVFFGEVIRGHRRGDVMHDMAELLELDQAECAALFSGARIVLKPRMDFFEAQGYEERLRELGARVHIEPADPDPNAPAAAAQAVASSGPAPLPADAAASAQGPQADATGALGRAAEVGSLATPSALGATAPITAPAPTAGAALVDEEVTCPHCGERQSNRIMCRSCGTDIPMALAHKRETDADARAQRLAQARARRGLPPLAGDGAAADAPSAWGLGLGGRLARLPYITSMALVVAAINLLFVFAIPHPSPARLYTMIAGTVLLLIFAIRLSVLRAHDFNGSGWWAALLLVPYVGAVVGLALVALPGMREDNDHGGRARPGNPLVAMMAVALMTLMLVATYRWVASMVQEVIPTGAAATPVQTEQQIAARLPSPLAVSAFRDEYMSAPNPKAFAVSPTGSWGWKASAASSEAAAAGALEKCDTKRKLYTPVCELVNVNDGWVQR